MAVIAILDQLSCHSQAMTVSMGPLNCGFCQAAILSLQWHAGSDCSVGAGPHCGAIAGREATRDWIINVIGGFGIIGLML